MYMQLLIADVIPRHDACMTLSSLQSHGPTSAVMRLAVLVEGTAVAGVGGDLHETSLDQES